MIVLLGLIQKLRKPPQGLSKTELEDAQNELSELTEAGFKLDWLKTKLEEVSLKRKNAFAGGCQVEEVEERIKNLELTLSDLKVELKSEKAKSAVDNARLLSLDDIL
ncbi:PREDICTED: MATH domain and coiled-coil domain-containing protein At2g42465-like [Camelina sativa]|uniref:MATH domain and coiled-coil domain-containing protein At2g42465-like n=1 Tax=Camelina sativa TaxID=90675 RepID=A0ABM1RPZ1_CAMSA|nr:PREDICTED: MATH domain and coiled-coil domain-containing protein At2g42465-like [Camelina sativa]